MFEFLEVGFSNCPQIVRHVHSIQVNMNKDCPATNKDMIAVQNCDFDREVSCGLNCVVGSPFSVAI